MKVLLHIIVVLTLGVMSHQFDLHKCCPEGFLLNGNYDSMGTGEDLELCISDAPFYKINWFPSFTDIRNNTPAPTFNKIVPHNKTESMKHILSRCNVHQLLSSPLTNMYGSSYVNRQGVFEYPSAGDNLRFTGAEFCVDHIQPPNGGVRAVIACPCFREPRLCRQ